MGAKSVIPSMAELYDEDFAVWAEETAALLRSGSFADIDVEHLAEEVEDMAKRDRRELLSRLTVLLAHLLKWKYQPKKRSTSWKRTIATQRTELRLIFEQSPSLRATMRAGCGRVYKDAVERAGLETSLATKTKQFPRECPFSEEQILDGAFLPD